MSKLWLLLWCCVCEKGGQVLGSCVLLPVLCAEGYAICCAETFHILCWEISGLHYIATRCLFGLCCTI